MEFSMLAARLNVRACRRASSTFRHSHDLATFSLSRNRSAASCANSAALMAAALALQSSSDKRLRSNSLYHRCIELREICCALCAAVFVPSRLNAFDHVSERVE
jgi:hypothetical protein